jgi:hypothetical protein
MFPSYLVREGIGLSKEGSTSAKASFRYRHKRERKVVVPPVLAGERGRF